MKYKIKIEHWDVKNSKDLVYIYNDQLRDTPYFYLVSPQEFENGIQNRNNLSNPYAEVHSEKIIVGQEGDKIIGFAHVSIGEVKNFSVLQQGGFIHFLTYQPGYRSFGQAILDECERYLHGLGADNIWAFMNVSNYPFYHLGFGYLSDKMAHVCSLFCMNRYEIDIGEIFMAYPEYDIPEPNIMNYHFLHDNQIKIVVERKDGRGILPNLHIQALRGHEEIGECYTVSLGEFYQAIEAQSWFFTKWLGIEEKEQGKGLGRYLLQKTLHEMRGIGYKNAAISTNVRNHRAQLFYTNFGYKVTDTSYEFVRHL